MSFVKCASVNVEKECVRGWGKEYRKRGTSGSARWGAVMMGHDACIIPPHTSPKGLAVSLRQQRSSLNPGGPRCAESHVNLPSFI